MSDNDKKDLTRIEDLSEFLHSEDDDDLSDIEAALSSDTEATAPPTADDEFSDMATDPDMQVPDGFNNEPEGETDFAALEDSEDEFPEEVDTIFEEPTNNLDDTQAFAEDDENDFESNEEFENSDEVNFESNDDFTSNEEDSFASDDDFTSNEEDSFTSDDDFTSNEEDSFTSDDDFTSNEEDSFASNDDFTSNEEDSFASNDDIEDNDQFHDNQEEEDNSFESNDEFENDTILDNDDIQNDNEDLPDLPHVDKEEDDGIFSKIEDSPAAKEVISEDTKQEETTTAFSDTEKTSLPVMQESDSYKNPENFKELQDFARNMSFGNMAKEGNPPFSIILKDIKYEEDLEDIIRLLVEYKIIDNNERDDAKASLARGNMLIPRLGEFAAISLCHKLRRYDINILMGLTEEVSPAKDYESDDRGLTTKNNIYNNKQHNWKFEKQDIQLNDIIVSTTPYIEGHDILEYISIVTESTSIDMQDFTNRGQLEDEINIEINNQQPTKNDYYPYNSESEKSKSSISLNDIYQSLVEKCKAHAINKKGNALVGINFQITPLLIDDVVHVHSRYQITCSGSVVWINKR